MVNFVHLCLYRLLVVICYFQLSKSFQIGFNRVRLPRPLSMMDSEVLGSSIDQCFNGFHLEYTKYIVMGAVAGGCRALSRGITFPFDTIKTLIQADVYEEDKPMANTTDVVLLPSSSSSSSLSSLSLSSYNKPKVNYFRGVIPTVTAAIPANALFFLVFNSLEKIELTWTSCQSDAYIESERLIARLVVSAIATLPQNIIKIPSELIKQRAQTQPDLSYSELFEQAYSRDGIAGFYRGWEAQLLREIPYNAFQMTTYTFMRDFFDHSTLAIIAQSFGIRSEGATISAIEGLLAASIAAILTQPADVMKTKMMTEGIVNNRDNGSERGINSYSSNNSNNIRSTDQEIETQIVTDMKRKSSFLEAAKKIYQTEGIAGFFQGLKPRLYIVSFGGMIYFWASSLAETWLQI